MFKLSNRKGKADAKYILLGALSSQGTTVCMYSYHKCAPLVLAFKRVL
jgi:hypothetical protein